MSTTTTRVRFFDPRAARRKFCRGNAYHVAKDGYWTPSPHLAEYAPDRFWFTGGPDAGWTAARQRRFLRDREEEVYLAEWQALSRGVERACPGCGVGWTYDDAGCGTRDHVTGCRYILWCDSEAVGTA